MTTLEQILSELEEYWFSTAGYEDFTFPGGNWKNKNHWDWFEDKIKKAYEAGRQQAIQECIEALPGERMGELIGKIESGSSIWTWNECLKEVKQNLEKLLTK